MIFFTEVFNEAWDSCEKLYEEASTSRSDTKSKVEDLCIEAQLSSEQIAELFMKQALLKPDYAENFFQQARKELGLFIRNRARTRKQINTAKRANLSISKEDQDFLYSLNNLLNWLEENLVVLCDTAQSMYSVKPALPWIGLNIFKEDNIPVEYKARAGIYAIRNRITHQLYIGQARNLCTRIKAHLNNAEKSRLADDASANDSPFLHGAIIKNSSEFDVAIVEYVDNIDDLNKREIHWIQTFNTFINPWGYNLDGGGLSSYKVQFTNEQIACILRVLVETDSPVEHLVPDIIHMWKKYNLTGVKDTISTETVRSFKNILFNTSNSTNITRIQIVNEILEAAQDSNSLFHEILEPVLNYLQKRSDSIGNQVSGSAEIASNNQGQAWRCEIAQLKVNNKLASDFIMGNFCDAFETGYLNGEPFKADKYSKIVLDKFMCQLLNENLTIKEFLNRYLKFGIKKQAFERLTKFLNLCGLVSTDYDFKYDSHNNLDMDNLETWKSDFLKLVNSEQHLNITTLLDNYPNNSKMSKYLYRLF